MDAHLIDDAFITSEHKCNACTGHIEQWDTPHIYEMQTEMQPIVNLNSTLLEDGLPCC